MEFLRVKGQGQRQAAGRPHCRNGLVTAHVDGGVAASCSSSTARPTSWPRARASKRSPSGPGTGRGDRRERRRGTARQRDRAGPDRGGTARPRPTPPSARRSSSAAWPASPASTSPATCTATSPDLPPQIGVLVATNSVHDIARDVAMHIAAMRPTFLTRDGVPAEVVDYGAAYRRGEVPRGGQARGRTGQDRPGPRERVLQPDVLLEQKFAKDQRRRSPRCSRRPASTVTGFARFQVGA